MLTRLCSAALAVGLALSLGAPAYAQQLSGVASVIDGDTLEIHGQRIRLFGLDTPESSQTCTTSAGEVWPCGRRIAQAVADAVRGKTVTCDIRDRDRYQRIVAVCHVGGQDLNEWIVEQGMAFAYVRYSRDYADEEARARRARRGIWEGSVQDPAEYRKQRSAR